MRCDAMRCKMKDVSKSNRKLLASPTSSSICANTSLKSSAAATTAAVVVFGVAALYVCMCRAFKCTICNVSAHKIQCTVLHDILIAVDAIKMILICTRIRNPFPIFPEMRAQCSTSTITNRCTSRANSV